MDPGRIRGELYRHLPRARGAQSSRRDKPPRTLPAPAEERNLRYDTRYIAPNGSTVLVGVLSMILGAVGTFVIVLAPLYAVAHAWGWLLRW